MGYVWGIALDGDVAYLIGMSNENVQSMDISNPQNPTVIGSYNLPGNPRNADITGDFIYVPSYSSGPACLSILNIADPANMTYAGNFDTPGNAWSIDIHNNYAYVNGGDYIYVFDITDPENPVIVNSREFEFNTENDIDFFGNYAVAPCDEEGLVVMDFSDPINPVILYNFDHANILDVEIVDTLAYILTDNDELAILDISRPLNMEPINRMLFSGFIPHSLKIREHYAYVVGQSSFRIIDISNPPSMVQVGSCGSPASYKKIELMGDYAYTVDTDIGLQVTDISDPSNPVVVASLEIPEFASELELTRNFAFIGDEFDGITIVDISDPLNPIETGYYETNTGTCDLEVLGNYVFTANGDYIYVFDCTEAINPEEGLNSGSVEATAISSLPGDCALNVNPNPFNASTVISFELRDASFVSLDIFDVTGRSVGARHAVPLRKWMPAGSHQVIFDAKDLTSGVYFARLEAGEFRETKKILLIK